MEYAWRPVAGLTGNLPRKRGGEDLRIHIQYHTGKESYATEDVQPKYNCAGTLIHHPAVHTSITSRICRTDHHETLPSAPPAPDRSFFMT